MDDNGIVRLVMEINELAEMQRDRGKCFEYLALAYFQNEPTYQNGFNTQLFSKSNLVHCLLTVDFKTLFSSP